MQELTGKPVYVRLKWGLEYKGFLVSTDGYMNLQVSSVLVIWWSTIFNTYHSLPTPKSSRMASQTVPSVKFSFGMFDDYDPRMPLTALHRCNNVLYIISNSNFFYDAMLTY